MAKSKIKTVFTCQTCGAQRPRWEGRCSDCGAWNSYIEENLERTPAVGSTGAGGWIRKESAGQVLNLGEEIQESRVARLTTGLQELDRVLGGGLVPGSFILLGGSPGVGKSTLLMQMAGNLAKHGGELLYVTGEESVEQTAQRAHRLGVRSKNVKVFSESNLEQIFQCIEQHQSKIVIIDSIQTLHSNDIESSAGTVSQVRECAGRLLTMAKTKGITVLLIGHITKDGAIAGPKVLEHMVDTVLAFDGDMGNPYRILRTLKNRFGAAFEMGVFRMISSGLEEVANPSEFFLEQRQQSSIGSAVYCSMEGSRPILCEIQALTVDSHQAMPRRTSVGIELNRVHMVSAVLSRHLNMDLSRAELYINVVGGLRLEDPASDLALAAAVLSTERRVPLSSMAVFFGEVGLTGEVRAVQNAEMRIKEAQKLGFEEALVPIANKKYMPPTDMKIHWIKNVSDVDRWIQGRINGKSKPSPAPRA